MVLSEGCIQYVADSHITLNSSSKALSLSKTSKIVCFYFAGQQAIPVYVKPILNTS